MRRVDSAEVIATHVSREIETETEGTGDALAEAALI